jgi:hypothetical protein
MENGMVRIFRLILVAAIACAFGNLLGFSQQSGNTNIAGGRGGQEFADLEPSAGSRVTEVRIKAGDTIDSVQMVYAPVSGAGFTAEQHGGRGGRMNTFRLDADEYITGISGRFGDTVDSMRIHTNKKTSPRYGGGGGDRDFRIDVPAGAQAIGFIGRAGDTVDAIGLIYIPIARPRGGTMGERGMTGERGTMGERGGNFNPYEQTELAGGRGGQAFSDRNIPRDARVVEIRIGSSSRVDSLQMIYRLSNGRIVEGERHGGRGGRERIFQLNSNEYVTGIFGRMGDGIDSLGIQTNRRTSPIYGGAGGNRDYRINVPPNCTAVGFAGRIGQSLEAIGLIFTRASGGR